MRIATGTIVALVAMALGLVGSAKLFGLVYGMVTSERVRGAKAFARAIRLESDTAWSWTAWAMLGLVALAAITVGVLAALERRDERAGSDAAA